MKQMINGKIVEKIISPAEVAELESANRKAEIAERRRPLTEAEVSRLLITEQINTLTVDDATALRMREFYPEWQTGKAYTVGYKVQYNGRLYHVVQAHTSQDGWNPEAAPALWEGINETYAGTEDDPIPYDGNMVLTAGLYYMQGGEIYRCTRDTGVPVYNPLAELVGIYVEIV